MMGAYAGNIGLNNDTAGVLIEAYRIQNGQNPIKDYFSPFSFITGGIVALALNFIPLSWLCGITNLVYCLVIYLIQKKNFAPDYDAKLTTLISSVWFMPQIGSFYYDNLSAIFGLLGILFLSCSFKHKIILAGLAYSVSFYIKQNTGFCYMSAGILMYLLKFNKDGIKSALILVLTFLLITILILVTLKILNYGEYFYNYFYSIIKYSDNTGKNSIIKILEYIYEPFNINIFNLNNLNHKGVILFYPIVILHLILNLTAIIKIFNLEKNNKDLLILNLSISSVFIQYLIGRGYTNINYNLPLLNFLYLNLNKKIRTAFYIILFSIGLVYFAFEINKKEYVLDQRIQNVESIVKKIYRDSSNNHIAIYGYSDLNRYAINNNLITSNFLIFNNNFIFGNDKSENILWQNLEIANLVKFMPTVVLIDWKESAMGDMELIKKYIEINYILIYSDREFELWQKK